MISVSVKLVVIITLLFYFNYANYRPYVVSLQRNQEILLSSDMQECHNYIGEIKKFLFLVKNDLITIELICSVIFHESRFNENALSDVGAYGLMQVRPIVLKEIFNLTGVRIDNIKDATTNIGVGIWYLDRLHAYMPERCLNGANLGIHFILSAYNHGPAKASNYKTCKTRYSVMVLNKIKG